MICARPLPFKCSAVISDVDGTLVTDDKKLTSGVPRRRSKNCAQAESFFRLSAAGRHAACACCSSRSESRRRSAVSTAGCWRRPIFRSSPSIFCQPEIARRAVDMLDARERPGLGFQRSGLARTPFRRALCRVGGTHSGIPAENGRGFRTCPHTAAKIVGVSPDFELLARCERDVRAALADQASVARSQPYYLDITHPLANKGGALSEIAKLLGVPLAEIAVIGDGGNDVAMFERSGLSIAMGNASPGGAAGSGFRDGQQ